MRQAGRYMAEYRTIRKQYTLLEICKQPELAAEVTLQPVNRLEIDAAILFSDLLLPLEPMGIPFDFVKGEGLLFISRYKITTIFKHSTHSNRETL